MEDKDKKYLKEANKFLVEDDGGDWDIMVTDTAAEITWALQEGDFQAARDAIDYLESEYKK